MLFEPHATPAVEQDVRKGRAPAMTPGRAALVGLMDRYLAGLLDPFVSLLEVHKLMYFMQEQSWRPRGGRQDCSERDSEGYSTASAGIRMA
jgi:hypothetical protein